MTSIDEIIDRLKAVDGITDVHIDIDVTVTHKRQNTGEFDNVGNPIREQVVSDDELVEISEDLGFNHLGTVDLVSDYRLRDKYSTTINKSLSNND